ncbi:hypothetical protein ZIOFF_051143 [Zingiber officinale]|uniref:Inhibitor I9 domain-containing protein n=1 Tax=Zingiber officinale TaxID=94328 RepID=A0A8J5FK13_ZINOF|nr:hypothetical protein ZIOFF_051143 [Zingiber officinale]
MAATTTARLLWGLLLIHGLHFAHSQVHIVYLGHSHGRDDPLLTTRRHVRLLCNVFSGREEAEEAMVYSYTHGFSGFAAVLNSTQVLALAGFEEVISVFRSKTLKLHTTRSWDFMGLGWLGSQGSSSSLQLDHGHDIIVGVLDSGWILNSVSCYWIHA